MAAEAGLAVIDVARAPPVLVVHGALIVLVAVEQVNSLNAAGSVWHVAQSVHFPACLPENMGKNWPSWLSGVAPFQVAVVWQARQSVG